MENRPVKPIHFSIIKEIFSARHYFYFFCEDQNEHPSFPFKRSQIDNDPGQAAGQISGQPDDKLRILPWRSGLLKEKVQKKTIWGKINAAWILRQAKLAQNDASGVKGRIRF